MKIRHVIQAITVSTALIVGLAVAPANADDFTRMTFTMHRELRSTVDIGDSGPSVGDIASAVGTVSSRGKKVGSYDWFGTTVRVNMPGGLETRHSTLQLKLPKGLILIEGMHSAPAGAVPNTTFPFVIVGGTGAYTSIRGDATYTTLDPITESKLVLRYRLK